MFVHNDDITLTELGGGVSRKVLAYDEDLMSVEVRFERAQSVLCIPIRTLRCPTSSRASLRLPLTVR